jgi:hypothetical protein
MFGGSRKILAAVAALDTKVSAIMSQDSTISGEAAAEETSIGQIGTALASIQALLTSLQGEQGLSTATLAAAAKVQTDLAGLATTAESDATSDAPPTVPTPTASS